MDLQMLVDCNYHLGLAPGHSFQKELVAILIYSAQPSGRYLVILLLEKVMSWIAHYNCITFNVTSPP